MLDFLKKTLVTMLNYLHALGGIVITIILIVVSFVLNIVAFMMALDGSVFSAHGLVILIFGINFTLVTFSHLNMWKLHINVSKIFPDVGGRATDGEPYASYIMWPRGYIDMHRWVKGVVKGDYGEVPYSLIRHAKFTLKANIFTMWFIYLTMVMPALLGCVWAILKKI